MKYTTLGKTGLRVSRMGLGGIPIQKIDAEGTKTLLHKLADRGVNYIDTARGYTVSEEYLGYALEGSVDDPSCTFAVSDVQDLNIIRNKSIGKLCEKLSLSSHTKTYESVVKWKLTFTFCIFYKERAVFYFLKSCLCN